MDKLPPKQKKQKGAPREELLKLDREDLVDQIIQLEAHNAQLKNIISKSVNTHTGCHRNDRKKPFDFSKCHYRRILLRLLYFGWDYQGYVVQEDSTQTVEHQLFHALTKSCLIESRELAQYHRCGRTDKAVSAFGQVISIRLRSKEPPERQSVTDELPYCKILNRLLPKEIRAVAWMPIPEEMKEYSARFDCKKRQYKYYFPRSDLNIAAMHAACSHLIGSHDFRHLCKMDVSNGVVEFTREIFKAEIVAFDENDSDKPTSMYYLLIEGNAFLWHQIRCIMGVLLLVGQGRESSDVILQLFDIDKNPGKPQYNMALDIPLNLFHCSYELEEKQQWHYARDELRTVISDLQKEWTVHNVKSAMTKDCLQELEAAYNRITSEKEAEDTDSNAKERDNIMSYADCLIQGVKPRIYTPLLKRGTCSTLEERIQYYKKKRTRENTNNMDI